MMTAPYWGQLQDLAWRCFSCQCGSRARNINGWLTLVGNLQAGSTLQHSGQYQLSPLVCFGVQGKGIDCFATHPGIAATRLYPKLDFSKPEAVAFNAFESVQHLSSPCLSQACRSDSMSCSASHCGTALGDTFQHVNSVFDCEQPDLAESGVCAASWMCAPYL